MLGAGRRFQGLARALQAADESRAQAGGEVGVFAVGLLAPAPAGIAKDVHVGRPHGQPVVDVPVAQGGKGVVLGPGFGGSGGGDAFQQFVVEHGRQGDGLGEAGGGAAPGQAVQGFVPPVVGGHAQTLDGRRVITQLGSHLGHRHASDQFFGQFFRLLALHVRPCLSYIIQYRSGL